MNCETAVPIPEAAITVRVDRGFRGSQYMGIVTYATNDVGKFRVPSDEPCDSWLTLFFNKDGFDTLQTQIKGTPGGPIQLCMTRTVSP